MIAFTLGPNVYPQHTISGTFSPAEDFTWLVAYKLNPGSQNYTADAEVKNGKLALTMPKNVPKGVYRMVYAIPQDQYYFDVIFNGKENIELNFNETDGVSFSVSEENKLFDAYFREINHFEQQIASYFSEGNLDVRKFTDLTKALENLQKTYEVKTEGMLVGNFIRANRPYIPTNYESAQDYVSNRQQHYFDALDLDNTLLQASGFLTNKLANYIFTALPLKQMTAGEIEQAIKDNVDHIAEKTRQVASNYKTYLFYSLWAQANATNNHSLSEYIFNNYLRKFASESNNQDIIKEIETNNRLLLGAMAPNFTWDIDGKQRQLHHLEHADQYILVFWSSSCSHCLHDLPELHNALGSKGNIRVIAIGLEEDAKSWKQESSKLTNFEHVLALGKWESDHAKLYDIHKTPSYFILDKDKRILAKPDNREEVLELLGGFRKITWRSFRMAVAI